jgi:2'-5' RNA ligase
MRLFVAIPISQSVSKELESWAADHKNGLPFRKWTHPSDYHITLQFLGDTSAIQREELVAALKKVKANVISLTWSGIGTFGPPAAPRVLWGAVSGDLMGLSALHKEVIKATSSVGFVPEDRPYSPHITLAKGFAGANKMPIEAATSIASSFSFEIDQFVLMLTHMNESPMYEVIDRFPLIRHE